MSNTPRECDRCHRLMDGVKLSKGYGEVWCSVLCYDCYTEFRGIFGVFMSGIGGSIRIEAAKQNE